MIGLKTLLLATGIWRATLMLPENELPFNMIVENEDGFPTITIINAQERIEVTDIIYKNDSVDSVYIYLPVFESVIKAAYTEKEINGVWIKYNDPERMIPIHAVHGVKSRFSTSKKENVSVEGNWEVWFSKGTKDEYKAKGIFSQSGNKVTGTFLTETGDYRYLQGSVDGSNLKLSCFDGSHAFLFTANKDPNVGFLLGTFYSGTHWEEPWVAVKNDSFELADPFELTYLKSEDNKIAFTFPGLNGDPVSLEDRRFSNKPVIIQLLGSWCPNCMDESRFYASIYDDYHEKGLEIIGLAFERSTEFDKAKINIEKMTRDLEINYPVLYAGRSSKKEASEKLPMLNEVISFPTSIFLNKKHEVIKIHTGFNGPATGEYFEKYKDEFMQTLELMLK